MRTGLLLSALSLVGFLASCSTPMDLGPASSFERLPAPMFTAYAPNSDGQRGDFTDIKVYEVRNHCTPPTCPLLWHVNMNEKQSPTLFRYGHIPGMGLNTLLSQRPLRRNADYVLILSKKTAKSEDVHGELKFHVDEYGTVIPIEEPTPQKTEI